MVVLGFVATYSARNSVTTVATRFLRFKAESIVDYVDGQWQLLVRNDFADKPAFVDAMTNAVETYARNTIRNTSELIFSVNSDGEPVFSTGRLSLQPVERQAILEIIDGNIVGWHRIEVEGNSRIAYVRRFDPLEWIIFVTETREVFYRDTDMIVVQSGVILAIALAIAFVLLIIFSRYITKPLEIMATTMTDIIKTQDLARRVEILYKDETGTLGHTFNIMISELEKAYSHVKGYALRAAVSNINERKIRNIFQKYVPKSVIDRIFDEPESILVGENRVLAVLFSDIRDFTRLSERMLPETIIDSLNQYFSIMVDKIVHRNGIVDKYIGDAIMAFFGAPVKSENDAYLSACAGLEMLEGLDQFNDWQRKHDRPPFRIGIGLNYGLVTVGNIGSDKKMDYTVIGDMVNLASRLENLTKLYGVDMIISESVHRKVDRLLPCRLLDRVIVSGRTIAGGIYAVAKKLTDREDEAWQYHREGMDLYYKREYSDAVDRFQHVQSIFAADKPASRMISRCEALMSKPPPEEWSGVIEMAAK